VVSVSSGSIEIAAIITNKDKGMYFSRRIGAKNKYRNRKNPGIPAATAKYKY